MPSAHDSPSREAMREEFSELVTICMKRLTAPQREILAMRSILNRSYDEIAQALEIEVGTVKSRIARARGQLRSLMAESCPELGFDALPVDWFEANRPSGTLREAVV